MTATNFSAKTSHFDGAEGKRPWARLRRLAARLWDGMQRTSGDTVFDDTALKERLLRDIGEEASSAGRERQRVARNTALGSLGLEASSHLAGIVRRQASRLG